MKTGIDVDGGWRVKHTVLAIAGGVLLADSLVLLALKKINAGTILPGCIGLLLLLVAFSHNAIERKKQERAFRLAWQIGCGMFFFWLVSLGAFIIWNLSASQQYTEKQGATPYLVVLGAGLRGDEPSPTLRFRLERALEIARSQPEIKIIVSGGQGANEEISEAESMQRYLVAQGLPVARITQENRSTDTAENLLFSRHLLESAGVDLAATPVGIVTSDFHALRAHWLARGAGYRQAWIATAPVPWEIRPNTWLREYFSVGWALMTEGSHSPMSN